MQYYTSSERLRRIYYRSPAANIKLVMEETELCVIWHAPVFCCCVLPLGGAGDQFPGPVTYSWSASLGGFLSSQLQPLVLTCFFLVGSWVRSEFVKLLFWFKLALEFSLFLRFQRHPYRRALFTVAHSSPFWALVNFPLCILGFCPCDSSRNIICLKDKWAKRLSILTKARFKMTWKDLKTLWWFLRPLSKNRHDTRLN